MTGYGKSTLETPDKNFVVEVKSLNSKNMDANLRMPSQYRQLELPLRNKISQSLSRGKVDFSLSVESKTAESSSKINTKLVENYIAQLQTISSEDDKDFNTLLKIAMTLPDAVSVDKSEIDEAETKAIFEVVQQALQNINEFRSDEGEVLKTDFQTRISNLSTLLENVKEIDPERIQHVKTRLRKGIEDLKENIDENRFEQELIYYIEKYDITEEKIRLDNHLAYFSKTLNSSDSNGKKLNFICQEIGREINTIGSKSNFAPMQKMVVQMKDELEKIKEQLLNVL